MSTFFEKLTGSSKIPSNEPVVTAARTATRSPAAPIRTAPSMPHRLQIAEEEQEPEVQPAQETIEDEGELTVDIYDRGDALVIQSTVAGVKPEDLDVAITSDTITIRGRREPQEYIEPDHYYYKELFWGIFSRSVILPEEVEDDEAEAILKHGLLTVILPKKRKGVVQKIKVKVS